jgi:hypothetical protein
MSIIQEMGMIRENVKLIKQFSLIPELATLKSSMHLDLSNLDSKDEKYEDKCAETVKSSEFYIRMYEVFPSFAKEFEALFIMILRDFDLGPLEFMLNTMEGIANGTVTKDKGEMAIGEHLAEKFIKSSADSSKIFKKNKSSKR